LGKRDQEEFQEMKKELSDAKGMGGTLAKGKKEDVRAVGTEKRVPFPERIRKVCSGSSGKRKINLMKKKLALV